MIGLANAPMHRPLQVVVTGAECTGKSTLCRTLGDAVGWPVVPESARLWVDRVRRPLTRYDVERIASLHQSAVREAIRSARENPGGHGDAQTGASGDVLLLDTDLFSTRVYSRHYLGLDPLWLRRAVANRAAPLYLLCDTDIPWRPDPGQRGSAEGRLEIQRALVESLRESGAWVVPVSGPPDQRRLIALRAIRALGRGASDS